MRSLRVNGAPCGPFDVVLVDGAEPAALSAAVAARAGLGLETGGFYLATGDGAVVPLTSSLPDALTTLTFHLVRPSFVPPVGTADAGAPSAPARSPVAPPVTSSGASSASPPPSQPAAPPPAELTQPLLAPDSLTPPLLTPDSSTAPEPELAAAGKSPERDRRASSVADAPFVERRPSLWRRLSLQVAAERGSDSARPAGGRTSEVLEGMERLNRLSTDLANERTLLAWIRTCLASMRTALALLAANEHAGSVPFYATQAGVTAFLLLASVTGGWRYHKIKAAVSTKVPPASFGRTSLRPINVLVAACAVTSAVGLVAQSFGLDW